MPVSGRVEKGMRKGTKSCAECRKRKVRCIFGADTEICLTCLSRGTTCLTQTKVTDQVSGQGPIKVMTAGKDMPLEARVAQLEALLIAQASQNRSMTDPQKSNVSHRSSRSVDEDEGEDRHADRISPTLGSLNSCHQTARDLGEDGPIGSLFDNAIWKRKPTVNNDFRSLARECSPHNARHERDARVCDELCKDLPPPRLLAVVITATSSWWNSWRAVGSWLKNKLSEVNLHTLQEAISWTLASNNPSIAALGILLYATCIQQLDHNLHQSIIRQLLQPPGELFHIYFDRVHRLIINNDSYLNSIPGVEVLMMIAKIYINLGLLKNAWILHHRAIIHAQLLGVHRPHQGTRETDTQMASRHETWFTICERDSYLSLLLGLPCAANWQSIEPNLRSEAGTLKHFRYQLIRLSARILDRNDMGLETSTCQAQEIEGEIMAAASQMPTQFWDAPTALQMGTIDSSTYMGHLASHFWLYQAKVLLHQPLMIRSLEDHQLWYHRNACLAACRDTLKIYHLMRSHTISAFNMVKLVDYQAFVCAAILLLGILGYGSSKQPRIPHSSENENDSEIVEMTMVVLRQASKTSNNTMASEAVQGLDVLVMLVRSSIGRDPSGLCTIPTQDSIPFINITVPGSGVITITPGKLIASNNCANSEPATVLMPPSFSLNGPSVHAVSSQSVPTEDCGQNPASAAAVGIDISMMDMDWTNMFELNDDWAWLANLNDERMV